MRITDRIVLGATLLSTVVTAVLVGWLVGVLLSPPEAQPGYGMSTAVWCPGPVSGC